MASIRTQQLAKACIIVLVTGSLLACGFALRGTTPPLDRGSLAELDLQCNSSSLFYFCNRLRLSLRNANISINPDAPIRAAIVPFNQSQTVFTLDSDASAAEFEIRRGIQLTVTDKPNEYTLSRQELIREQVYRDNDTTSIAKDRERLAMEEALFDELVRAVMNALAQIKPLAGEDPRRHAH